MGAAQEFGPSGAGPGGAVVPGHCPLLSLPAGPLSPSLSPLKLLLLVGDSDTACEARDGRTKEPKTGGTKGGEAERGEGTASGLSERAGGCGGRAATRAESLFTSQHIAGLPSSCSRSVSMLHVGDKEPAKRTP